MDASGQVLDICSHSTVVHQSSPVFFIVCKEGFTVILSKRSGRTQANGDELLLLIFSASPINSFTLCDWALNH